MIARLFKAMLYVKLIQAAIASALIVVLIRMLNLDPIAAVLAAIAIGWALLLIRWATR